MNTAAPAIPSFPFRATLTRLTFLLVALGWGAAATPAWAQDAAAGKERSSACVECHGVDGVSPNREWPNLAGQKYEYMVKHLRKFRDGIRTDPLMEPVARTLTDKDINDLAAYYSAIRD